MALRGFIDPVHDLESATRLAERTISGDFGRWDDATKDGIFRLLLLFFGLPTLIAIIYVLVKLMLGIIEDSEWDMVLSVIIILQLLGIAILGLLYLDKYIEQLLAKLTVIRKIIYLSENYYGGETKKRKLIRYARKNWG